MEEFVIPEKQSQIMEFRQDVMSKYGGIVVPIKPYDIMKESFELPTSNGPSSLFSNNYLQT